jgi:hypothetical protein
VALTTSRNAPGTPPRARRRSVDGGVVATSGANDPAASPNRSGASSTARAATRSGRRAVRIAASVPPSEWPATAAVDEPVRAVTASRQAHSSVSA